MEISSQIKKYRHAVDMSQEALAESVYVTRQTVSNWENGKSYPDIHSLLMLCELFNISLDILVKGDIKEMKGQIKKEDIEQFNRDSIIFSVLMLIMLLSAAPLIIFIKLVGGIIWLMLAAVTMFYSIRIERQKKNHDIHTYKEIVAFTEGNRLDEIRRQQEIGKRPYQKVILAVISAVIAVAVFAAMTFFIGLV